MLGQPDDYVPPTGIEVRLETFHCEEQIVLCMIEIDPTRERGHREWRRWPTGVWTSPMPMPDLKIFDL